MPCEWKRARSRALMMASEQLIHAPDVEEARWRSQLKDELVRGMNYLVDEDESVQDEGVRIVNRLWGYCRQLHSTAAEGGN